jgi:hypothetical protein
MLSDLTHIPRIMRGKGWLNGARLLDQWFSRGRAVAPAYSPPDTTTIRMDGWVLTFARAKEVYDQLVRERIWSNAAARPVVTAMLRRKGLLGMTPRPFGRLADPVPSQDPDYVNQRPAGGYTHFDDMTAALGNFNLRVVVAGTVAPVGPGLYGHQVQITEVGVYVRDSFDFEGDQYLGCWSDNPDGFFPIMPPDPGAGMSFPPPMFSPVGNRDFREWRNRTARGGDFLVFSDLKRVPVNPPDTFTAL